MDKISKEIIIVAGGGIKHLEAFVEAGKKLNVNVTVASFSDMTYVTDKKNIDLRVKDRKLTDFGICYIRLAGKRYEDVALLVSELKRQKIKIVDQIYDKRAFIRLPLPKSIEAISLIEKGIPVPKTLFGTLNYISAKAPGLFGYPFVIKGTTGKQGHAVWSPENESELKDLINKLSERETLGERFIAQEFIKAAQRERIFVIGDRAIAGITRPTRWRKRFVKPIEGVVPDGIREKLNPPPKDEAELAVYAAKSLFIDIAGVDILRENETNKLYVLEVNSAPRWVSLKKDTDIKIEEEILKYLISLL